MTVPKKTPRPPGPDDWAAERIRYEREKRRWSTGELANRVTKVGVSLRQQQVWQVESGEPRRRLSVGEAAAFAKVFDLSIAELLTPPEELRAKNLVDIARDFAEWRRDLGMIANRLTDLVMRVQDIDLADDEYIKVAIAKYPDFREIAEEAEQMAVNWEREIKAFQFAARSAKDLPGVWAVIFSLHGLIMEDENEVRILTGETEVDKDELWRILNGEDESGS